MLTIDIAGKYLPIPLDFSMQLTWKSPVFDFEKNPTGFALDFSFPINDFFQALFGNPQRYAKYRPANDQKFPDFHVRFFGAMFMAGTLSINDASGGNYNCSLIDQVGVLGETEQERTLLDIPFFAQEQTFVNKTQYTPEADPYACFPISNPNFFKEKGLIVELTRKVPDTTDPSKLVDETCDTELLSHLFSRTTTVIAQKEYGARVNNTNADGRIINQFESDIDLSDPLNRNDGIPLASKVSVVSPFFFLNYIIKHSLLDNDIHILSNFLNTKNALKNLCIYNTFDITNATFTTDETYTNIFHVGSADIKIIGTSIEHYIRGNNNKIIPKNHLPKMKVGELLLSTQNLFNVCFHILPNSTVNVYWRDALLSGESTDLDKYFLGTWDIGEKKNVALKFTREHDDKDLVFSERYTDLSDRRNDIKGIVWDWDALKYVSATEGDIRFIASAGVWAEYKWISTSYDDPVTQKSQSKEILGWEEASIGLQNGWYEFGRDDVEEIKSGWSAPYSNFGMLTVQQSGNTAAWPSKSQAFGPRLMFRVPDYTLLGDNAYDSSAVADSDKLYLEYEKPSIGLFSKLWSQTLPFWANRLPVTGTFDLPVNVLRHLIYNICKKYRTREGEFLIDEISCTIYIDRISEVTIKGFKVD
jgi:hypothetical protein